MFEYTKEILKKVSFDKVLFRKELVKALRFFKNEERHLLMIWCLAHYGQQYSDIITQVFKKS